MSNLLINKSYINLQNKSLNLYTQFTWHFGSSFGLLILKVVETPQFLQRIHTIHFRKTNCCKTWKNFTSIGFKKYRLSLIHYTQGSKKRFWLPCTGEKSKFFDRNCSCWKRCYSQKFSNSSNTCLFISKRVDKHTYQASEECSPPFSKEK